MNIIHRVHREITTSGTGNLPADAVPPGFETAPLTLTMVVRMAVLSFERQLKKKKKR